MLTPVILAGGFGTRLWPMSRKDVPKQFAKLLGPQSLFQDCATRLKDSNIITLNNILTLTNNDYRFLVRNQLQAIGLNSFEIMLEPESKNTAASILAASLYCFRRNKDEVLLVTPSDHFIDNTREFHKTIEKATYLAEKKKIVLFGVKPNQPKTEYGYIEFKNQKNRDNYEITKFIEKPDYDIAKNIYNRNNYFWNSGIFLFKAKNMIDAFKDHDSTLYDSVSASVMNSDRDLGFVRLEKNNWAKCRSISIDYCVIEKSKNLSVVPLDCKWTDLGNWDSIWENQEKDNKGVVLSENTTAIETKNALLRSDTKSQHLVGLGIENIIAIAMPDAVLIANKSMSGKVGDVVKMLKLKDQNQAESFSKEFRPWGWFENLVSGEMFKVKKIFVEPGESLSLQSHKFRSEHWVVVKGIATITIDSEVKEMGIGESCFIQKGSIHRLANNEKYPMILIEVQIGKYLEEDDIFRYEDKYSR